MEGRIGRLRCRYRVIGSAASAPGVVARLERHAAESLERACSDALEEALGDDPAVYVLRRVEARLLIGAQEESPDRQVRRWGERLAGAVVRTIARDPDDSQNLIRFPDQAAFVAQFVEEVLDGVAWERWYFGAFAALRPYPRHDVLRRVLLDNGAHLAAILATLQQRRVLERLLAALDRETRALLWTHGLRAGATLDPDGARPLFAEAVRLADALGLWSGARPETEALFQEYLRQGAPAADWRSRAGLAEWVVEALRFLASRSLLRAPDGVAASLRARIDVAVAGLDWLDARRLADRLETLLRPAPALPDLPTPSRPDSATPRQRALLALLTRIIREAPEALEGSAPDSEANALRLYARVTLAEPAWTGDPLAFELIERLLAAWARHETSYRPERGAGDGRRADGGAEAHSPDPFVAALGEAGREALVALQASAAAAEPERDWIETECAGALLLLRPCVDLRLPGLAAGYAPLDVLLVSLGIKWFGDAALRDGRIDSGLLLLAGCDEPLTPAALEESWRRTHRDDHARFEEALLGRLIGLRCADREARSLDELHHARPGEAAETFSMPIPGADDAADRALSRSAAAVVRAWAFWLQRFADSSLPYLLHQFLHRGGRVSVAGDEIRVELEPLPLDEVLRRAGYFDELAMVPWLPGRRIRFTQRGRS